MSNKVKAEFPRRTVPTVELIKEGNYRVPTGEAGKGNVKGKWEKELSLCKEGLQKYKTNRWRPQDLDFQCGSIGNISAFIVLTCDAALGFFYPVQCVCVCVYLLIIYFCPRH